jgi:hypothetical protein
MESPGSTLANFIEDGSLTLVIGAYMSIMLIYALFSGRAYGLWRRGIAKEMRTRWHYRKNDPWTYWKIVMGQAFFALLCLGAYFKDYLPFAE